MQLIETQESSVVFVIVAHQLTKADTYARAARAAMVSLPL